MIVFSLCVALAACSSPPANDAKQAAKKTGPVEPTSAIPTKKHPLAKYVELVGFRLSEAGGGKLKVKFAVVNHSEADIGDLGVRVRLTTSSAKPDDPPIATFDVKVPSLGPEEVKDVSAATTSKLRVYELPDWQFLKAEFEITSPEP